MGTNLVLYVRNLIWHLTDVVKLKQKKYSNFSRKVHCTEYCTFGPYSIINSLLSFTEKYQEETVTTMM